jgi:hypothetical protein
MTQHSSAPAFAPTILDEARRYREQGGYRAELVDYLHRCGVDAGQAEHLADRFDLELGLAGQPRPHDINPSVARQLDAHWELVASTADVPAPGTTDDQPLRSAADIAREASHRHATGTADIGHPSTLNEALGGPVPPTIEALLATGTTPARAEPAVPPVAAAELASPPIAAAATMPPAAEPVPAQPVPAQPVAAQPEAPQIAAAPIDFAQPVEQQPAAAPEALATPVAPEQVPHAAPAAPAPIAPVAPPAAPAPGAQAPATAPMAAPATPPLEAVPVATDPAPLPEVVFPPAASPHAVETLPIDPAQPIAQHPVAEHLGAEHHVAAHPAAEHSVAAQPVDPAPVAPAPVAPAMPSHQAPPMPAQPITAPEPTLAAPAPVPPLPEPAPAAAMPAPTQETASPHLPTANAPSLSDAMAKSASTEQAEAPMASKVDIAKPPRPDEQTPDSEWQETTEFGYRIAQSWDEDDPNIAINEASTLAREGKTQEQIIDYLLSCHVSEDEAKYVAQMTGARSVPKPKKDENGDGSTKSKPAKSGRIKAIIALTFIAGGLLMYMGWSAWNEGVDSSRSPLSLVAVGAALLLGGMWVSVRRR